MRRQLFIPDQVREAVAQHIRTGVARAVQTFGAGAEEEDALTGQLGMPLMIPEQTVEVTGEWVVGQFEILSTVWRGASCD